MAIGFMWAEIMSRLLITKQDLSLRVPIITRERESRRRNERRQSKEDEAVRSMAGVFQARMEEELAVPCWFRHNWNHYYQDDRRIF
ncbi:hypothetical protein SDJN02_03570, partial [Cucurbita argyrosperma subsp. argyrosperma]